jgi:hypothetical protein
VVAGAGEASDAGAAGVATIGVGWAGGVVAGDTESEAVLTSGGAGAGVDAGADSASAGFAVWVVFWSAFAADGSAGVDP